MIRRDTTIALTLFGAALIVRLIFAARLVFPPLDDPAFYAQTARHLAFGRGLVIDAVWSYQFPFAQVTHPSHEYWMPLATFLIAPFVRLFGDTLFVAQLPGAICGALLGPLTYRLGRRVWPDDRRWAIGAAALMTAGALPVYQSASTDSSAPFALFAALALLIGGEAIENGSPRRALVAGLLGGLAYLARSDGLLIPVCLAGYAALRRELKLSLGFAAGASAVAGLWWLRNLSVFGVMQPVSPWTAAALQSYGQLFNWNDPPTLAALFDRGLGFIVDLRAQALLHNLGVWALLSFPFGVYGLPGLFAERRPIIRVGLIYALTLLFASAIIFSVPTLAGLFYHSAGAALPWLAVGALGVTRRLSMRLRPIAIGVYAATLVLTVAQAALAWPPVIQGSVADRVRFDRAAKWLNENAPIGEPVIATQAHSLNYASGYPALTLPNAQGVDVLRELADHYGARFVVITERVGLYPDALDAAGVPRRFDTEGVIIYDLGK